jgi:S1-C subfamily serine protease
LLDATRIGRTIEMTVLRNNRRETVAITPTERRSQLT